jgi:4-hydroxybenzoate polyprenyltransferase
MTKFVDRLAQYALLMRLEKPIGWLLLLWPTLWALWIASDGQPDGVVTCIFIAGVIVMRSAGCVINDFADRELDPHVERTRARPIAAGKVAPFEALGLFVVLLLLALILVMQLNRLTIGLSIAGAFLAGTYPFVKRFTHLPQFYLGVAFGWGIPMAFAATLNALPTTTWVREDDLKVGTKSTAILFGGADRAMVAIFQSLAALTLVGVGLLNHYSPVFFLGIGISCIFFVYQHWLIRDRERMPCFAAFKNNNWFGLGIFSSIVLETL